VVFVEGEILDLKIEMPDGVQFWPIDNVAPAPE
jgi:hypothetical protein